MSKGRVAKDGVHDVKRYQVMLDDESKEIMLRRGDGNLSLGIRRSSRCCNTIFTTIDKKGK